MEYSEKIGGKITENWTTGKWKDRKSTESKIECQKNKCKIRNKN